MADVPSTSNGNREKASFIIAVIALCFASLATAWTLIGGACCGWGGWGWGFIGLILAIVSLAMKRSKIGFWALGLAIFAFVWVFISFFMLAGSFGSLGTTAAPHSNVPSMSPPAAPKPVSQPIVVPAPVVVATPPPAPVSQTVDAAMPPPSPVSASATAPATAAQADDFKNALLAATQVGTVYQGTLTDALTSSVQPITLKITAQTGFMVTMDASNSNISNAQQTFTGTMTFVPQDGADFYPIALGPTHPNMSYDVNIPPFYRADGFLKLRMIDGGLQGVARMGTGYTLILQKVPSSP